MRPLRCLLLYAIVVLGGGALLAPWVYWLVQALPSQGWVGWMTAKLAGAPFHRYVHRLMIGLALALVWPLMRQLGVVSWAGVGLVSWRSQRRRWLGGLTIGFVSLALVAGLTVLSGARIPQSPPTAAKLISIIVMSFLTAITVAGLEEILFRGAIFGALRPTQGWKIAAVISAGVYALVHFFQRSGSPAEVRWYSGFSTLASMSAGFMDLEKLFPGFLTLGIVGVTLALAYQRTGNLWFSMGLHGGWIFWTKIFGAFTKSNPGAGGWFWGTDKLIDGWLALIVVTLVWWGLDRWWRVPPAPNRVV